MKLLQIEIPAIQAYFVHISNKDSYRNFVGYCYFQKTPKLGKQKITLAKSNK